MTLLSRNGVFKDVFGFEDILWYSVFDLVLERGVLESYSVANRGIYFTLSSDKFF